MGKRFARRAFTASTSDTLLTALVAGVLLTTTLPLPCVRAQEAVPQARQMPSGYADMRIELTRMQYNTDRGPFLAVIGRPVLQTQRVLPGPNAPGPTPLMLADAFNRRIFLAGSVTVLAPSQMTIINTRPGKAAPLLDLPPDQRLKALLSTLTDAQWQRAGSAGLALSDLTDDQQALMAGTWPSITRVQKMKAVAPPDKPNVRTYETQGEPFVVDPRQIRLRFSRIALYQFHQQGQPESRLMSGTDHFPRDGEIINSPLGGPAINDRTSAYGVKVIAVALNRLKPGAIDFAAPGLDALVPLQNPDGTPLQTIGDLLKQVSTVTGLDVRADARITTQPLYVRAAPDQKVRAGDALMALAYSVTGAYRRLTPRLFLLTDDVEGIGTRFARLNAWAGNADQERYDLLERISAEMAKRKPLQYLNFSASYNTLPGSIAQKVEADLTKNRYSMGMDFKMSDLPTSVQKDVEAARETWERPGSTYSVDHDTVSIGMAFKAQWVLPDGGVLDYRGGIEDLHPQFIGSLIPRDNDAAAAAKAASSGKKTTSASLFTPAVARRVLAISPKTPEETRQLIRAAVEHGFNEIWVRQNLSTVEDSVIKTAVAAGKTARVPILIMPSLLRANGIGVPERTILSQTATEWAADYVAGPTYVRHPDWKQSAVRESELYQNWTYPVTEKDENTLLRQLTALAQIPGIRGLCLTHTTPPGYYKNSGGTGLLSGSEFGYTLEQRLRFLDTEGYDPIDLIPDTWSLQVDKSLSFFPHEQGTRYREVDGRMVPDTTFVPPVKRWEQYLDQQVRTRLGQIFETLHTAQPKLPLYLEDRVSEYTSADTAWFGLWNKANRLPENQPFLVEYQADNLVRAAADVRLLRTRWDKRTGSAKENDYFLGGVQRAVSRITAKPGMWQGIAVDLSALSATDALQMLDVLPAAPTTMRPQSGRSGPH